MSTVYDDLISVSNLNLPWEQLNYKNILITGATGLIGSSLAKSFLVNHISKCNLYVSSRNIEKLHKIFNDFKYHTNLHFIEYDVLSPLKADIKFDYIIDCASPGSPNAFKENPVEVILSNVLGANNLIKYGLTHKMIKMIYISSGEIYGEGKIDKYIENYSGYVNPLNPRSCYPTSKRAAESLCVSYAHEYKLNISICRPCHIYGPYFQDSDNRAYAQFFRNAINKNDIVLKSAANQIRSWCYVSDCVAGILYVLFFGENGSAYNISPIKEKYSIKQFANEIAKQADINVIYQPTESYNNTIITHGVLDSTSLQNLGWSPRYNITSGIHKTLEIMKYLKNS